VAENVLLSRKHVYYIHLEGIKFESRWRLRGRHGVIESTKSKLKQNTPMTRNRAVPTSPAPGLRTPSTLKSHIFHGLRDAIVSGRYRPGDRLNESKIAREFGISRIPVREALMQLQEHGLVMNHERRGMFVTLLSEEDVQRINSLRVVLEAEALGEPVEPEDRPEAVGAVDDLTRAVPGPGREDPGDDRVGVEGVDPEDVRRLGNGQHEPLIAGDSSVPFSRRFCG